MKMESPLEVLSRAVSIVQNENKANSHPAPLANSDSGIEDDMTTEYDGSPNHAGPLQAKSSPRRNPDSDQYPQYSLDKSGIDIYLRRSQKCLDSEKNLLPKPINELKYEDTEHSPIKPVTDEYLQNSSPKASEVKPPVYSPKLIKSSPMRDYESDENSKLHNPVDYFHRSPKQPETNSKLSQSSSLRREYDFGHSLTPPERLFCVSDVKSLCKPDNGEQKSQLSLRLESDKQNTICEYKRKSPKNNNTNEDVKRIKLEEPDQPVSTYPFTIPTETIHSKSISPRRCSSEPRFVAKPSMEPAKSPGQVPVFPHYLSSYPAYPPLFILTDKPTNYSKLMATYDSIFAPTPPVLPPYLPPAYLKCNCGDKNCTILNPPKPPKYPYSTSPEYKEKEKQSEPAEYSLPNVDEHFRKSLGEKYELIKCDNVNERPSSVDDHFAKALGQKWFSMDGSQRKT